MTFHGRSLECRGGRSPLNKSEMHNMARRAWHESGVLTVRPEDVRAWEDRQHLVNIGNALYGQRSEK